MLNKLMFLRFMVYHHKNSTIFQRETPGRVAQSVGHLPRKSGVLGSISGLATYFRFSFRFFKKGMVNRLGGLSLPRKSVVRLTDRPDMTLAVYRGQQQCNNNKIKGRQCLCLPLYFPGQCIPFKLGSTLKEKNLLLEEQILFFKS